MTDWFLAQLSLGSRKGPVTYLLDMYLSSEVSIDVGINQQMKHMENVLNLSFFFREQ